MDRIKQTCLVFLHSWNTPATQNLIINKPLQCVMQKIDITKKSASSLEHVGIEQGCKYTMSHLLSSVQMPPQIILTCLQ